MVSSDVAVRLVARAKVVLGRYEELGVEQSPDQRYVRMLLWSAKQSGMLEVSLLEGGVMDAEDELDRIVARRERDAE